MLGFPLTLLLFFAFAEKKRIGKGKGEAFVTSASLEMPQRACLSLFLPRASGEVSFASACRPWTTTTTLSPFLPFSPSLAFALSAPMPHQSLLGFPPVLLRAFFCRHRTKHSNEWAAERESVFQGPFPPLLIKPIGR